LNRLDAALICVLAVFFAVGAVGLLIPTTHSLMLGLTPLALLFTAAVVAVPLLREREPRTAAWAAAACAAGFALEAAGVATGRIFGEYAYGTILGPKALGVPLIIGLNWALVILGSVSFVVRFVRPPLAAAVLAGALTAFFDWVLEPVAVSFGYWTWAGGAIPVRNYLAWFLIAGALAFLYTWRRVTVKSWLPAAALTIQASFFTLLRLASG
jgi:putative membrane protein